MSHRTLHEFLARLEDDGELVRVEATVAAELEIAAITQRVREQDDGGPALLFENVAGQEVPVVTNLLGSRRRMLSALGTDCFDGVAKDLLGLLHPEIPENWLEALRAVPRVSQLTSIPPRTVKNGDCQQVVKLGRDVDLRTLPIPRNWPSDAAAALTAGLLHTRHPVTGIRDVELAALTVRDERSLHVRWTPYDDGRRNFEAYRSRGERMPVAVAFGGDPLLTLSARAPLPLETDPWLLAGLLRKSPVELVRGRSVELDVPTHAEIVLEGYLDPSSEPESVGSTAAATGFAGPAETAAVLEVSALTHRANPVLPAIVPGPPPSETHWLDHAIERLLVPFVRLFVPEVVDLHFSASVAARNLLCVAIEKRYPQQARKVMNAVWALGPLMHTKIVIVVDADVDVSHEARVWWHVGANVHPDRDVAFWDGPAAFDDHAAPVRGVGRKMGLDATRKLPEEGHPRDWPAPLRTTNELRRRIDGRWTEYGIDVTKPDDDT